ncbi:MAG: hypothetical protein ACI4PC_05320 [Oscillospiraceae bacterium]
MKTKRRAILILAELLLAAVLGWFLWGFAYLSRDMSARNLQERFLLPRAPELIQELVLSDTHTDLVFDTGEEYLLATDSFVTDGEAGRFYGAVFFPKDPQVTVIPAFAYDDNYTRFLAVGQVPGAAYAEAEAHVYRDTDRYGQPQVFDALYTVDCEIRGNVTVLVLGRDAAGELSMWDDTDVVSSLRTAATSRLPWKPDCDLTLRYYGGDGRLLAEYRRSLKSPLDNTLHDDPAGYWEARQ